MVLKRPIWLLDCQDILVFLPLFVEPKVTGTVYLQVSTTSTVVQALQIMLSSYAAQEGVDMKNHEN